MTDEIAMTERPIIGSIHGYRLTGRPDDDAPIGDPQFELATFLAQFSFKSVCGRAAVITALREKDRNAFSDQLKSSNLDPIRDLRPYVIRRVVLAAAIACPRPDTKGGSMSALDLHKACRIAEELWSAADEDDGDVSDLPLIFARIQQEQFHDLVDRSYVRREIAIALDVVQRCRAEGLDLDSVYRREGGVSFSDIAKGCLLFWARILSDKQEGFYIPPGQVAKFDLGAEPETVLSFVQATRDELLIEFERRCVAGYESYSLSPLKRYPVVVHADGLPSVPIASDLMDRPGRLFFYDLIGHLGSSEQGVFRDAIGASYAEYVRGAFEEVLGSHRIHDAEKVLHTGTGEKVCDFVCEEPNWITLVEVKSSRMPMHAQVTQTRDQLRDYIGRDGSLATAVAQLSSSATAYREGRTDLETHKRIVGLVVMPGERIGYNSTFFRDIIRGHQTSPTPFEDYLVADDLGFDSLMRTTRHRKPMARALWRILRSPRRHDDLHTSFENVTGAPPLLEAHRAVVEALARPSADAPPERA